MTRTAPAPRTGKRPAPRTGKRPAPASKRTTIVAALAASAPAPAAPPVAPPAPVVRPLAESSGQVIADAIRAAVNADYLSTAVGALKDTDGRAALAADLVGDKVRPTVHLIGRIIPVLRSPAPAALFSDGNNRGARIGDLFATRLGLSGIYRDVNRADLKAAREALKAEYTGK